MTPTTEFKTAAREHTSFLAAAEKRTLIWIANRLPAAVNSDHLTALGFVSLILAGASYWYASVNAWALLLVIPLLALNWFGDSLDGTLARVRNRQRPRYGFYVDHILDALGMSFLMAVLLGAHHPQHMTGIHKTWLYCQDLFVKPRRVIQAALAVQSHRLIKQRPHLNAASISAGRCG